MATIPPPLLYCNSFISKTYISTGVQTNFPQPWKCDCECHEEIVFTPFISWTFDSIYWAAQGLDVLFRHFVAKSVSLVMWIHGEECAWNENQAGEGNHSGTGPGRTSCHLTKQKPILLVSLCSQQLFSWQFLFRFWQGKRGCSRSFVIFMSSYFFSHPKTPSILPMVARSYP
jgi:hypothetical protein